MSTGILIYLLIKIFIMIVLGYVLRKKNIITEELHKGLSNLLMYAVLPSSILSATGSGMIDALRRNLCLSTVIVCGYYVVTLAVSFLISRGLSLPDKKAGILVNLAVFANIGFIGFPLIKELYGDEGTIYAVIYNLAYQIFVFTFGVFLLSGAKKMQLKKLIQDPTTIASVIAAFLFVSPVKLPSVILGAFSSIGDMVLPISMMIVGSSMVGIKFSQIIRDKYSFLVSLLRLAVFPLVMLAVLKLLRIDSVLTNTIVVLTALPCGSLNVIMAEQYDCEPVFAAQTVIQSMVLMLISVPLIILLLERV